MQDDFVPRIRPNARAKLIERHIQVLEACETYRVPVLAAELIGFGRTIQPLRRILDSSPHARLCRKYYNDAFQMAFFERRLQELRARRLMFMGVNAAYCVLETAESAFKRGYDVITSPELISGQRDHPHDDCREWYQKNGTFLPTTAEAIELIAA